MGLTDRLQSGGMAVLVVGLLLALIVGSIYLNIYLINWMFGTSIAYSLINAAKFVLVGVIFGVVTYLFRLGVSVTWSIIS